MTKFKINFFKINNSLKILTIFYEMYKNISFNILYILNYIFMFYFFIETN